MRIERVRPPVRASIVAAGAAAVWAVAGCTTAEDRIEGAAASHGYSRSLVQGEDFRHVVFANGRPSDGANLHVYLEGDGSPYLDRWTVAPDPTPRRPLMLDLMALDPAGAIYAGRPCYLGLASDPPCTPVDWTLGRFSERVVASLASVIETERREHGAAGVELFGHSGGGTLAVLLAARMPDVRRVVTLAGNLDTDAWADLHGYTRLSGSLNPALGGPLPEAVQQRHYAGGRDRTVPASLVVKGAATLGAPPIVVLPDAGHTSGWTDAWPAILTGQAVGTAVRASGTSTAVPP